MHHPVRRKMLCLLLILLAAHHESSSLSIKVTSPSANDTEELDNNIIDFDSEYDSKLNQKYGMDLDFNKANRYTIDQQEENRTEGITELPETTTYLNVIPIELLSTTEDELTTLIESTTEPDLTVIPLSITKALDLKQEASTVLTTDSPTTTETLFGDTTETFDNDDLESTTVDYKLYIDSHQSDNKTTSKVLLESVKKPTTSSRMGKSLNVTKAHNEDKNNATTQEHKAKLDSNITETETVNNNTNGTAEENVRLFTELDVEDLDVPEDYYDSKDVIPTSPPNTDALSVIFGLAGSVVESVAEKVVPKGIFDLFKRIQKQNEELEVERLRSREENGGIGQFGRGILKSISTSISKPFTALMGGVRDIGSLDTDRGFVSSAAAGVSSVASSLSDAFKNKVQAIYPGTLWCGDGHSAQARSSDLGLFFFTDTCCREHDACKIYIRAGETKFGLTNTGLFTRSHCLCDAQFRACLRRTSSLVSSQIGLTYFNVLGPQCFRKTHPIVRCLRKTRLTGQKCEDYELDYTQPKMWQWFDNETF